MRIRLHEIPEEGKSYLWTHETGELKAVLADLIGDKHYKAEFFIKPLNSRDFELVGTVKTEVPEQCSRCGLDFDFDVNVAFREILIPRQPQDRKGHYAKVNHLSDANEGGPSTVEYDADDTFNVDEYLHEQVAIDVPFNPAPKENEKGDCRLCGVKVSGQNFSYIDKMAEETPVSPFAVLKNLKLQ